MFCKNCGSRVEESAKFCPRCGEPADAPVNPEAVNMSSTAAPASNVPPQEYAPVQQIKKKKPFFKRPAGIILIILLVIIIGGGITAFAMFDTILKAFLGPVNYYLYKESKNLSAVAGNDYSLEGDLSLGDEFTSVSSMLGEDASRINVSLDHSNDEDKDDFSVSFMGLYNFKIQKDGSYISVDTGDGNPVVANLKGKKSSGSGGSKKKSSEVSIEDITGLDDWEFTKWAMGYTKSCVTPALEGNIYEDDDEYNGMDCSVTEFVIDMGVIGDILTNTADRIEEDDETADVFENIAEYINKQMGSAGTVESEDIVQAIESCASDCYSRVADDDSKVDYQVYYYGGKVVNRNLSIGESNDGMEISLGNYSEDDTNYIEIRLDDYISGELEVSPDADVDDVDIDKENAVSLDEFAEAFTNFGDSSGSIY